MMTSDPRIGRRLATQAQSERRLAWIISEVFTPPVVDAILLIVIAWHSAGRSATAVLWAVISIVFVCVIPMLVIARGVRRRQLTDHHVGVRQQRPVPLALGLLSIVLAMAVFVVGHGPRELLALVAAMAAVLLPSIVITLSWKISLHSATAAGAIVVLVLVFGPLMLLLAPVVALVSWARVVLKTHTTAQVIAGVVLAIVTATPVFLIVR